MSNKKKAQNFFYFLQIAATFTLNNFHFTISHSLAIRTPYNTLLQLKRCALRQQYENRYTADLKSLFQIPDGKPEKLLVQDNLFWVTSQN